MTFSINVEKLPRKVLENAVKLNDTLKRVYNRLYFCEEHTTSKEIAQKLGFAREYIYMRLCQLESMGLVKRF